MSRSSATSIIEGILADPEISPCLVHLEREEARGAEWAELPPGLPPGLRAALEARGQGRLYSHQRAAYDAARAGKNLVVVTPTASGKTLCYNLPVAEALLSDPEARALYLFPTKALSQDQQAELNELALGGKLPLKVFTYDGDTPDSLRVAARDQGRIVITNPDMLHAGVLPNHAKWIRFFAGLRYVVVDEMHAYRGVFGSHVANVIRRLKRVAAFYGSHPRFILSSATIANPAELAEALVGEPVEAITRSGAPRGERLLAFYNPPLLDPVQGIRKSVATESERLALKLLGKGVKTILFARSRLRVELIASYINEALENLYTDNSRIAVKPYRGGLLPSERRAIERGLREGSIQGVVSTNALELGIDVGGLDAAVVAGFPGSFASFWQQAGRAGRRGGLSVAFLVASSAPLDQYIIEHPEYFFGRSPESGRIDPANPYIFMDHVKCAAFELPFREGEAFGAAPLRAAPGAAPAAGQEAAAEAGQEAAAEVGQEAESAEAAEATAEALGLLEEEGLVRLTGGRWYWSAGSYPSESISLRSATADNVVIVDRSGGGSRVIGEMDRPSAKELIFDDAVYIHLGRQYIVRKLDLENRTCFVEEKEVDFWTDAVTKTDLEVLTEDERVVLASEDERVGLGSEDEEAPPGPGPRGGAKEARGAEGAAYVVGDVLVRTQVEKFKKLRFHSHENVGYGEVHLPPEEMQTRSLVLLLGPGSPAGGILGRLGEAKRAALLAAAGRLVHDLAPVFLMCDGRDLGLSERVRDPHFGLPAIYLFDKYPGGTGLAEGLGPRLPEVFSAALLRLSSCPCAEGCPSCIGVDFLPQGALGAAASFRGSEIKALARELFAALAPARTAG